MTDIVGRLHAVAGMDLTTGPILAHTSDTAREAADEIERLRESVADLQAKWGYTESIRTLEIEKLCAEMDRLQRAYDQLRETYLASVPIADERALLDKVYEAAKTLDRYTVEKAQVSARMDARQDYRFYMNTHSAALDVAIQAVEDFRRDRTAAETGGKRDA